MELESNDALVRWMEHEGLSPFTLLKITPKPTATGKKLPPSVTMEWGVEDLEHEGDREKFSAWIVSAEGLATYRVVGDLDRFEECHTELGDGPGIDVRLEAGGTLHLRCDRLVVRDEPVERLRKGQPRPHHGELHLELDLTDVTVGELRGWLGVPTQLVCHRQRSTDVLANDSGARELDHAQLVDDAGHPQIWLSLHGERLTVARGKWATDALWNHVWTLVPKVPGVTRITSRDWVGTPELWPSEPPPKPKPQVWPNVYGVTCEFAGLTLHDLRSILELPATCPFVFERADAPEPRPDLELAEAARRHGTWVSGVFHDERGGALVHCKADVRENTLAFRRERACDDATWRSVWRAPERLPNVRERHSRTTQSPPDPWPAEPPSR